MPLDKETLDILACPESNGPLVYFEAEAFLFCPKSQRKYTIKDGIPVMLVDESEKVSDDEAKKLLETAKQRGLANAN
jgi:uncharacterized protein